MINIIDAADCQHAAACDQLIIVAKVAALDFTQCSGAMLS